VDEGHIVGEDFAGEDEALLGGAMCAPWRMVPLKAQAVSQRLTSTAHRPSLDWRTF
jgi:hypothetical protein